MRTMDHGVHVASVHQATSCNYKVPPVQRWHDWRTNISRRAKNRGIHPVSSQSSLLQSHVNFSSDLEGNWLLRHHESQSFRIRDSMIHGLRGIMYSRITRDRIFMVCVDDINDRSWGAQ